MRRALLVLCASGCALGVHKAERNAAFVRSSDMLLLSGDDGVFRVRMNGSGRETVLPGRCTLLSSSSYARLHLLGCHEPGGLFALDHGTRVRRLLDSVSEALLTADDRRVAAIPLSRRELFIIDLDTLGARYLLTARPGHELSFAHGAEEVFVNEQAEGKIVARHRLLDAAGRPFRFPPHRAPPEAARCQDGRRFVVSELGDRVMACEGERCERVIARIRGGGEIGSVIAAADCATLAFDHAGAVYAIDLASGRVGRVSEGRLCGFPRR